MPVLKAVCSRSEEKVKAFAEQWGYESYETDWKNMIERDDIDAIDICTPNDTHAEIAIAAAKQAKWYLPKNLWHAILKKPSKWWMRWKKQMLTIQFGTITGVFLQLPCQTNY